MPTAPRHPLRRSPTRRPGGLRRLAGAGAVVALLLAGCAADEPRPPDVILIDLESVRADHVGHLGYRLPTTRNLDGFASRAALFTHARSPSSDSVAASAALLTGLSPGQLRIGGGDPRLPEGPPVLAERLSSAGWLAIGRSHHPAISDDSGFGRGFDAFQAPHGEPEDHPDTAEMVDWLREWLAREDPPPFFLYLHPMDGHGPYRVPPAQQGVLLGRPPGNAMPYGGALMQAARNPARRRVRASIGEREIRSLTEQYDTALRYGFDRVAQMLAILRQAGRLDGALVVITANHGEELFDHGGFDHGRTLYEEVLRVPLYVKLPHADTASRIDEPVSTLDVMPTILALLELPGVPSDGVSLAPLLRGERTDLPDRDFVHAVQPGGPRTLQRALLRDRLKLIERPGGAELYDLALDPREQDDRSAVDRTVAEALRSALSEAYPPPGTSGSGGGR